jgi:hypothetical protein
VLTALNSERYDALLDALDALITSPLPVAAIGAGC